MYQCGENAKSFTLQVYYRMCQNCVELDSATLAGLIITDIIATVLLALGVYCFAGHETGRFSRAADTQVLMGNDQLYQPLRERNDAQYSRLGDKWARNKWTRRWWLLGPSVINWIFSPCSAKKDVLLCLAGAWTFEGSWACHGGSPAWLGPCPYCPPASFLHDFRPLPPWTVWWVTSHHILAHWCFCPTGGLPGCRTGPAAFSWLQSRYNPTALTSSPQARTGCCLYVHRPHRSFHDITSRGSRHQGPWGITSNQGSENVYDHFC